MQSVGWLLWLAWRDLTSQRWRTLLSLLALALSVGLLVATSSIGLVIQSVLSKPVPLAGQSADFWITSAYDADYDLPAGLVAQIEAVPGIAGLQPVLRRPVQVRMPLAVSKPAPPAESAVPQGDESADRVDTLTLLGIEPRPYFEFHDLHLAAGTLPSRDNPGLVGLAPWAFVQEVRLGQPLTLTTPSGDLSLPLVGLIELENLAVAQQGLVLYAPLDMVQHSFDAHGMLTALEVRAEDGVSLRRLRSSLEQALGPAYALSLPSGAGQGAGLWPRLVLGTLLFVDALALVGSMALIRAAFAAAGRARRRQIGLLRVAGALRRQVMAMTALQAICLGVVGSAAGLLLGWLFANMGASLVLENGRTSPAPPPPFGWLALAIALGIVGSLAGAAGPAIRTARQSPLTALGLAHLQSFRTDGSEGLQPPRSPALSLLGKLWSTEARLAGANLLRERPRVTWTVGGLALILAMFLGSAGILSLLSEELAYALGQRAGADYVVVPALTTISLRELAGQDTSDVPPLPPSLLAELEKLGDQVWLMRGTTADVKELRLFPGQPTLLLDIGGYAHMGGFRFEAGDWTSALDLFEQGPAVLLAPVVARRLNVGLGDYVYLSTYRGPVSFRVAGIGDSEFATCVLDLAHGMAYLGANEVNGVMIQIRPRVPVEVVRQRLLNTVHTYGGTLLSTGQVSAQLRAMFRQGQLSLGLLIGIIGLVAVLGVMNSVTSSVMERRREIGLLRAVGATRRQIERLILIEMTITGIMAGLIGTMLGWVLTAVFWAGTRSYLGLGAGWAAGSEGWLRLGIASVAGLLLWPVLAVFAGLIPARLAARLPVLEALYEVWPQ